MQFLDCCQIPRAILFSASSVCSQKAGALLRLLFLALPYPMAGQAEGTEPLRKTLPHPLPMSNTNRSRKIAVHCATKGFLLETSGVASWTSSSLLGPLHPRLSPDQQASVDIRGGAFSCQGRAQGVESLHPLRLPLHGRGPQPAKEAEGSGRMRWGRHQPLPASLGSGQQELLGLLPFMQTPRRPPCILPPSGGVAVEVEVELTLPAVLLGAPHPLSDAAPHLCAPHSPGRLCSSLHPLRAPGPGLPPPDRC